MDNHIPGICIGLITTRNSIGNAGMFGFMPGKALKIVDIQTMREPVVVKF